MTENQDILRLLLVTDSLNQAEDWTNALRGQGYAVRATREDDMAGVEREVEQHKWDLLIVVDGLAAAKISDITHYIAQTAKDMPCLAVVSESDAEQGKHLYQEAVRSVVPSQEMERLVFAVERELSSLLARRKVRQLEVALQESEKREQLLLAHSDKAIAYIHEGMHVSANPAYLALFGYEDDLDGLPLLDLVVAAQQNTLKAELRDFSASDDEALTLDLECMRADSGTFTSQLVLRHAQLEDEMCIQATWLQQEVVETVVEDGDTAPDVPQLMAEEPTADDVLNRKQFMMAFDNAVAVARSGDGDAAVLYFALDDFGSMKAQVGLGGMETIIENLAQVLFSGKAEAEILGKMSERALMMIVQNERDSEVDARAAELQEMVSAYMPIIDDQRIDLSCSVGVCRLGENTVSTKAVLTHVDKAWEAANKAGGNRVQRHQIVLSSEERGRQWERQLEVALQKDNFQLLYQPIVGLHGESQIMYETLLRCVDDDGELRELQEFLPSAEAAGLMADIDKWVVTHTLAVLREAATPKETILFINLSEQTMCSTKDMAWLHKTLSTDGVNGEQIVIEISETLAMKHLDKVRPFIGLLKKLGCRFSLQGFGSGLDTSQSLKVLDIDFFKINGAFVENMVVDKENQQAVKRIADMIKEAGKISIAERVADAQSLAILWGLNVDYAQGHYMREPTDKMDYDFSDGGL